MQQHILVLEPVAQIAYIVLTDIDIHFSGNQEHFGN